MFLTLQIAVGIWLGGLFLIVTIAAYFTLAEKIEKNHRFGYSWYHGLLPSR